MCVGTKIQAKWVQPFRLLLDTNRLTGGEAKCKYLDKERFEFLISNTGGAFQNYEIFFENIKSILRMFY